MGNEIEARLLQPDSPSWASDVDALREAVGAPNNVHLIPPHFLKATLPKIGGKIATITKGGESIGAGFLFPRGDGPDAAGYTLRLHWKDQSAVAEHDAESAAAGLPEEIRLAGVTAYDPTAPLAMTGAVVYQDGDLTIETPDASGAEEIRWLQDQIWKPEIDYLYPVDIHSPAFRPGTSLVARVGGEPVAFLFGFYKLGGPKLPARLAEAYRTDLRLESQLMGVLPDHRARGLGFLLKKTQALLAQQDGVDVVNWTVDPLQYGNAVLNFSKLRGVAFDHYPDYYAFRNALNQTAASRFNISWLVKSPRVQAALDSGGTGRPVDLADRPDVRRVNQGPGDLILTADDPEIAVEVPAHWTTVQGESAAAAQEWREATDTLLQNYVGSDDGKYAVTDAARDGDRRYLLAKRVTPSLLATYL